MAAKNKIVIISAIRSNAEVLTETLGDDYEVLVTANELDISSMAELTKIDLIILDVSVPGLDNIKIFKNLKDNESTVKIPVIFVANQSRENTNFQDSHSFSHFSLSKPIYLAELSRVISSIISFKTWAKTSRKKDRKNSLPSDKIGTFRVLIVDDTAINRQLVMEILRDAGVVVETANDGREAVEKAAASVFDAILMDIQMPNMNGYIASRTIREKVVSSVNLPIIAMTADASKENREKCLAAGMNDLIAKPVDQKSLLATLLKWTSLPKQETLLSPPGRELGHHFGQSSHKIQELPKSSEHPQSLTKQDHQNACLGSRNDGQYQGNSPDTSGKAFLPDHMEKRSFYRYNCGGECRANILFESGREVNGILKDLSIIAGFFFATFLSTIMEKERFLSSYVLGIVNFSPADG